MRLPALVADWGASFDLVFACWYLVDRLAGQAPMPVSAMLYCRGVIYIIYITVLGRTDFELPIFLIILSCFIEMDLSQKMFLLLGQEKKVLVLRAKN